VHVLRKAKAPAVELDRRADVVDDVADADGGNDGHERQLDVQVPLSH
jgi:hypothetical protein